MEKLTLSEKFKKYRKNKNKSIVKKEKIDLNNIDKIYDCLCPTREDMIEELKGMGKRF